MTATDRTPDARPIPRNGDPAPDGYHYEAVPHRDWRVGGEGKRCRAGAGYHKAACGAPAVAELRRTRTLSAIGQWWAYCPDHMYGRWIENGVVMRWVLREDAS